MSSFQYALTTLCFALVLTCITEGVVVLARYRDPEVLLASILCNVLTNPVLNLLGGGIYKLYRPAYYPYLVVAELLVVFIEARIYRKTLKKTKKECLQLSLYANFLSFVAGLII